MSRVLPKPLQVEKIRQWLIKEGYPSDLIDVEAEVDATLTFRENLKNIKKKVLRKRLPELEETLEDMLRTAHYIHEMRSPKAIRMDNAKKARIVIKPKPTPRTLRLIEQWMNNPAKMDIEGIDVYPFSKKTRRRRRR